MPAPKVLLIDDDNDNLEILEAALVQHGFECTKAASSADAKEVLAKQSFDALVSDYSLGDGDAIELLASLGSARPRLAILVTGYGSDDDRARSKAAGFDEHLVKPIAFEKLVAALER